ncbi:MAG: hypothetical protein WBA74_13710 [Cyclobacteriaceae bacterium]
MYRESFIFWIPLVVGTLLLLLVLPFGLKTTSDSFLYLEGAAYLKENGFINLFEQPAFLAKPILFSLLLIPFTETPDSFGWLQLVFFCFSYSLSHYFAAKYLQSVKYRLYYNLLFVTSTPLIMDHVFLWTEPVFICLLLVYAVLVYRSYQAVSTISTISLISVALLVCSLKHVGIFFILPTAGWMLVTALKQNKSPVTTAAAALHMLLPLLYFIGWQWAVWHIGGNQDRIDHFAGADVFGNSILLTEALTTWFAPRVLASYISWIVVPALFVFIFRMAGSYQQKAKSHTAIYLCSMCLLYFLVLVSKGDMIFSDDERYISVMFPFVTIFLLSGVERITKYRTKIKPLILSVGGVILLYNLIRVCRNVWFWSEI